MCNPWFYPFFGTVAMAIGQIFGPKLYAVMSNSGILLFIIALLALMAEVDKDIVATRNISGFLMQVAKIGDEISVTPHPRAVQSVSQAYNMERSKSIRGLRPFKKSGSNANKSSHSASTAITEPTSNVTKAAVNEKERPSIILESSHKSPLFDEEVQLIEMRDEEANVYLNSNEDEIDSYSKDQNIEVASQVNVEINLNHNESQQHTQVDDIKVEDGNEWETATKNTESPDTSKIIMTGLINDDGDDRKSESTPQPYVERTLDEENLSIVQPKDSEVPDQKSEILPQPIAEKGINDDKSNTNMQLKDCDVEDSNKSTPVAAKAIMKGLIDDVDVFIDEEIGDVAKTS